MAQGKSSKQKRQAQNKQTRQAQAARRDNARNPGRTTGAGGSSGAGGRPASGGRLRGLLNPRPPVRAAAGGTSAGVAGASAGGQPIGYRAALSALFAAVAAALMCVIAVRVPVDADGDFYARERLSADWAVTAAKASIANPELTAKELPEEISVWAPNREKERVAVALWPYSLAIVLPVIGTALGFQAVRNRKPSKLISRAMFATLLGALLTQALIYLFLPAVIALGVAMYQVRKVEQAAALAARDAAAGSTAGPAADEVIEAEVVDDASDASPEER